jgi:hypothetical protein
MFDIDVCVLDLVAEAQQLDRQASAYVCDLEDPANDS